ncbi:MAG: CheR family methyltransferase [Rhodobacterales bacterium]
MAEAKTTRTADGADVEIPVVAVGASAGGVSALETFFANVPEDSGFCFVVVLHMADKYPSALAEILDRAGPLGAKIVEHAETVAPGTIRVIPPGMAVTLQANTLLLKELQAAGKRRPPVVIDRLFTSVAEERGRNAACVVLSGAGSDGAQGLRAVKEHGGLTLAQEAPEHAGMMHSAVQTGLVDIVAPVQELPQKVSDYFAKLRENPDSLQDEIRTHLRDICKLLQAQTGHDFTHYKESTILRRIQRRMQVSETWTGAEFIAHLHQNPREVDLLFQDLLIGVTSFFRDRLAFEALEKRVIAPLMAQRTGEDETIRIWVPGCASGEEAYSIAILLAERIDPSGIGPKIQIFASDIDEQALSVARIGRFPASIAEQMSAQRLERFFVAEEGSYLARKVLREMILFSSHNVLHDPPFSKLDLISCRNLLIYLDAEVQDRLIPLFNYALNEKGFLFLGSSEGVTRQPNLFAVLDKTHRIFQRRSAFTRLPSFPLSETKLTRAPSSKPRRQLLQELAQNELLGRFSPPAVLVTRSGEVLHVSGRTGKYLEMPVGAPDSHLHALARFDLRFDLRAVLQDAHATGKAAERHGVLVTLDAGQQMVDLIAQPVRHPESDEPLYLVVFRDIGGIRPAVEDGLPPDAVARDGESGLVQRLERELRVTQSRLQAATEELGTSTEELKIANEEMASVNEELQSSNEELETSKEELSSINEELQTVNAELNDRVAELSRANSDIQNLLEGTKIATIFLDDDLRIKTFTPTARELFYLVESDEGRPLAHVHPRFDAENLITTARKVLNGAEVAERTIKTPASGAVYAMRILPYQTEEKAVAGVVITFVDISRVNYAEDRVRALSRDLSSRVRSLETLLELVPVGIFIAHSEENWRVSVNPYAAALLGQEGAKAGLSMPHGTCHLLETAKLPPEYEALAEAARTGKPVSDAEIALPRTDGSTVEVMISAMPLTDEHGTIHGAVAAAIDISERKKAEAHQLMLLHELQHRVKNILATINALTKRMLRMAPTKEDFAKGFLQRLQGMARTHELLSQNRWEGANIDNVLRAALMPFVSADGTARFTGAELKLVPNAAATLGMVFHELANNAAKYGALSGEGGRLEISWGYVDGAAPERLRILWEEHPSRPTEGNWNKGFGMQFIERSISHEFDGEADFEIGDHGLICRIEFPAAVHIARTGTED